MLIGIDHNIRALTSKETQIQKFKFPSNFLLRDFELSVSFLEDTYYFHFYLKSRKRQRYYISWFTLQMPATAAGARPGQSEEHGTQSRSPGWLRRPKYLDHLLPSRNTSARSWIGSGMARAQTRHSAQDVGVPSSNLLASYSKSQQNLVPLESGDCYGTPRKMRKSK